MFKVAVSEDVQTVQMKNSNFGGMGSLDTPMESAEMLVSLYL
jgi:hypothetical protein